MENVSAAAVTVVIVNYRTPELALRCLASLRSERALISNLQVIMVDGGSEDGSAEALGKAVAVPEYESWVSFLPLSLNGGYGWANNQAILRLARAASPPEFVHLLNPDAELESGAIARLVEELSAHPRCGAAGSQLVDSRGILSASAFSRPTLCSEFARAAQSERIGRFFGAQQSVLQSTSSCDVDWVTGASVMFRVRALVETGLFDDGFFLYFEEVELMHRLRRLGWIIRFVPASRVLHLEGASTGVSSTRPLPPYWYRSRLRYFALTGGRAIAFATNLAWLAGRALAVRKAIRGQLDRRTGRARDLLRFGFWPEAEDTRPAVARWGDEPGHLPRWMNHS